MTRDRKHGVAGLGDTAMIELGRALKTNRTLTALRIDDNLLGLDGLKALALALKSNKKIVDLPMPDGDVAKALSRQAQSYQQSLQTELQGRQTIKSAYGRGGYCNYGRKNSGLQTLKAGKKAQAQARLGKDKLRTLVASLQASILRNQEVAMIKGAKGQCRGEVRLAQQAAKAAAKAKDKADTKREEQKVKLWERRHELLTQWRKAVKDAAKKQQFNVSWFDTWLREWAKPYLNPQGLRTLWRAIPEAQKEHFEPLRDRMRDAFAQEEDMDAKVEALLQEARQQESEVQARSEAEEPFMPSDEASRRPNESLMRDGSHSSMESE